MTVADPRSMAPQRRTPRRTSPRRVPGSLEDARSRPVGRAADGEPAQVEDGGAVLVTIHQDRAVVTLGVTLPPRRWSRRPRWELQ